MFAGKDQIYKHHHGPNFALFRPYELLMSLRSKHQFSYDIDRTLRAL